MSRTDPEAVAALFEETERVLAEERKRMDEEREAMEAFRETVREISPEKALTSESRPALQVRTGSETTSFDSIRAAYESTFMAVDHHEEDYDETYIESVTEEFGPDMAVLLATGTEFTVQHKRVLLSGINQAVERRESVFEELQTEMRSIREAAPVLVSIATELTRMENDIDGTVSPDVLDAYEMRLNVLLDKCNQLLVERQSTVVTQRRKLSLPLDAVDVPEYVYSRADFEATYPVLSTLATLTAALETLGLADTNRELSPPVSD